MGWPSWRMVSEKFQTSAVVRTGPQPNDLDLGIAQAIQALLRRTLVQRPVGDMEPQRLVETQADIR